MADLPEPGELPALTLRRAFVVLICLAVLAVIAPSSFAAAPPRTGFEQRDGADWTTQEEEVKFLAAVDRASPRVTFSVIGRTLEKRPLHLVRIGVPAPRSVSQARTKPVVLFVCTQHGNEPAGREACLQRLRDLAFTTDPQLIGLLRRWTVLVVPTANPDGRAANTRENTDGTDINRDHLNLTSLEAQAIGRVIRDWHPDVSIDLHEYGPGIPVLYDDDLLYLWPRNLNVDPQVHGLSKTLAIDYIGKGAEAAGYSADEYGLYAAGDQDVAQTAGDEDEGIMRNAAGLRHSIGILVETRVDMRASPDEFLSSAAVNKRRVASHIVGAIDSTLRFMREQESIVELATEGAPVRKAREGRDRSAPVYFGGADNDPPEPNQIQNPPPCGYALSPMQAKRLSKVLDLLGVSRSTSSGGAFVPMGQGAEPLIPLLLDARGARSAVGGRALSRC